MLIVIDGNAMGHAHHNSTTLTCGSMQTQAIFGFVRMLNLLASSHPDGDVVVLWDGRAQFRYDLFPEYKANRDVSADPKKQAHRQAYREQVPHIKVATKLLGVRQMICENLEADDLAGWMVRKLSPTRRMLLVTGDQDWLQLVNENVTWLDPRGEGKRITHETFQQATGYFTPQEFLQGKALRGDKSDEIPPVGGIGEKGAPVFLAAWRSVENFLAAVDEGKVAKMTKAQKNLASPEGRAAFNRNICLMDLRGGPEPDREKLTVFPGSFNEDMFRRYCERFSFLSILKDWDRFIQPFKAKS